MTVDLLLDEEDYQSLVQQVEEFAEDYGVEMLHGSNGLIQVATTMLLAMERNAEAVMELTRFIYNVGYRDNKFRNLPVH